MPPARKLLGLLVALYLAFLLPLALWPFVLSLPCNPCENAARLTPAGLDFPGEGIVLDEGAAKPIVERLSKGAEITVAVWFAARNAHLIGPARLISLSDGPLRRNFMIGQADDELRLRLRTPLTGENGAEPEFIARDVLHPGRAQVVVGTYDGARVRLYVDGEIVNEVQIAAGGFEGWDPDFTLVFGNETTGDRPWLGAVHDVAIYDRALPADRVRALSKRGVAPGTEDLVYRLAGRCPFPSAEDGTGSPGACTIPASFVNETEQKLLYPSARELEDYVLNFGLFLLPGALLALAAGAGWPRRRISALAALLVLYALVIEVAQILVPHRTSSLHDLVSAWLGIWAGYAAMGWLGVRKAQEARKRPATR